MLTVVGLQLVGRYLLGGSGSVRSSISPCGYQIGTWVDVADSYRSLLHEMCVYLLPQVRKKSPILPSGLAYFLPSPQLVVAEYLGRYLSYLEYNYSHLLSCEVHAHG